jgi:oxepin-CoA hydrolase/3-oxo-5,6-dehydrosuberyl-CoA semialdehyde dehydrogenase
VGGPALRGLTFPQRAAALKALGAHLMAVKEEFSELSFATGATKRDGAIDLDGGFGTLLVYASKGRRELPDGTVLVDGPVEQLGRGGTFVGRHIMTPLQGAAVQVNAYNFPVWGMLEKLAPAFLAGVPSIVKPAGQTAYLTEQVVRSIVDSGLLPEGSLQLLIGGTEGLVDALDGQDLLSFTGSAATGRCCAPTRRSCSATCGSTSRPTPSTAPCSGWTRSPARRSSTCSYGRSCGR